MNKRIISALLALAMLFSLAACGDKEDKKTSSRTSKPAASSSRPATPKIPAIPAGYKPGERTIKLFEEDLNAAKGPIHMKLRMEMELEEGKSETVETTLAAKDGVSGTDFTSSMGHMGSLYKDEVSYTIMHDQKMAMAQSEKAESPLDMTEKEENYYRDKVSFTAGSETVNGVSCDYDEMTEPDGKVSRMYFLSGTDKWVYMREGDSLIEVIDYGRKPDESLLSIPADYTINDFSGMGGGSVPGMEGMEIPGMEGLELPDGMELPEGFEQYLPEGFDMGSIPGMTP